MAAWRRGASKTGSRTEKPPAAGRFFCVKPIHENSTKPPQPGRLILPRGLRKSQGPSPNPHDLHMEILKIKRASVKCLHTTPTKGTRRRKRPETGRTTTLTRYRQFFRKRPGIRARPAAVPKFGFPPARIYARRPSIGGTGATGGFARAAPGKSETEMRARA